MTANKGQQKRARTKHETLVTAILLKHNIYFGQEQRCENAIKKIAQLMDKLEKGEELNVNIRGEYVQSDKKVDNSQE